MTSTNGAAEEDSADHTDSGERAGTIPAAPADHEHTVAVVLTLECGHEHRFTRTVELLSMYPGYALNGTSWQCLPCRTPGGPRLGPNRKVVRFRYDYRCQSCRLDMPEDAPPADDAFPPPYQRFNFKHPHTGNDIAGYVIVRIEPGAPGTRKSTDVATVAGAQHYAHATAVVDQFDRQTPDTATAHAIVFVFKDGCRHDRV